MYKRQLYKQVEQAKTERARRNEFERSQILLQTQRDVDNQRKALALQQSREDRILKQSAKAVRVAQLQLESAQKKHAKQTEQSSVRLSVSQSGLEEQLRRLRRLHVDPSSTLTNPITATEPKPDVTSAFKTEVAADASHTQPYTAPTYGRTILPPQSSVVLITR